MVAEPARFALALAFRVALFQMAVPLIDAQWAGWTECGRRRALRGTNQSGQTTRTAGTPTAMMRSSSGSPMRQ